MCVAQNKQTKTIFEAWRNMQGPRECVRLEGTDSNSQVSIEAKCDPGHSTVWTWQLFAASGSASNFPLLGSQMSLSTKAGSMTSADHAAISHEHRHDWAMTMRSETHGDHVCHYHNSKSQTLASATRMCKHGDLTCPANRTVENVGAPQPGLYTSQPHNINNTGKREGGGVGKKKKKK